MSSRASNRGELAADVDWMPSALSSPDPALAHNGYVTESEVVELESGGRDGGSAACARLSAAGAGEAGRGAEDGLAQAHAGQDGDQGKPGALPAAEADSGAGVRDRQGGDGIPAVFAARTGEGGGGVGLGDAGLQLQAIEQQEICLIRL